MSQSLVEFRSKFQVDALALFSNDGWTVSLRPRACTLGACVISANRPRRSLAEIDAGEAAALIEAVAWFESRARAVFLADKFNYLALMMVDDHLHFHALPRYATARAFAGASWPDPGWPGQPDLTHAAEADDGVLDQVRAAMQAGGSA